MRHLRHKAQFCVVGGGLAGMSAAISAARKGVKVALIHDRPVLGGNASSEIRMWVCGAVGLDNRETGIVEEILLENRYRNPSYNYSIWDSILYEKVRFEPNIELFLNCTCLDAETKDGTVTSVKAWQMTTETFHTVQAPLFADCSGDSILAELCGADFTLGRESESEYGESLAPRQPDKKTMGMSCLLQVRQRDRYQEFIPPDWAYKYDEFGALSHRDHSLHESQNFWWIEVGGEDYEAIHDTEKLRDELLKIVFGVWDHIKNRGDHGADNWALDWVGFLPGKRESRRYLGDYVLTQNDINLCLDFDDTVAYGGWPIDDHHPGGFYFKGDPTEFHGVFAPFKIPYRCLYSRNISNLFCAGRNISVSHIALASTRVMATCAVIGQAVGNAASIAAQYNISPREVYKKRIEQLQQRILDDDCFLPDIERTKSPLTRNAALTASAGEPEVLRSGIERDVDSRDQRWQADLGESVCYEFDRLSYISEIRLVFDSDLNRSIVRDKEQEDLQQAQDSSEGLSQCQDNGGVMVKSEKKNAKMNKNDPARTTVREMRSCYPLDIKYQYVPETIVKSFKIEMLTDDGYWQNVLEENNNYQRLYKHKIGQYAKALRFVPLATWGAAKARLYAFDVS